MRQEGGHCTGSRSEGHPCLGAQPLHPCCPPPAQSVRTAVSKMAAEASTTHHWPCLPWTVNPLYLQLSSDPTNKELPAVLSAVNQTLALDFIPHMVYDVLDFIIRVEIWDLSWEEMEHRWAALASPHMVQLDKRGYLTLGNTAFDF